VHHNIDMVLPVSVQICTLNEERNIGPCLESVWKNDPAEVIVVDGGSTDSTVEIARTMGARVLSPGRLGLGPSRQLGFKEASQPFSAFIDADDRVQPGWIEAMLSEMQKGGYSALQSTLRAVDNGSWWERCWNEYFIESIKPKEDTTMVGRPAIFVTEALLRINDELISLDEDTHMSRRFEKMGLRQGIGHAVAYRHVEDTWKTNTHKWQSYGRGYREFVARNPDRRFAIWKHIFLTIPVTRSIPPMLRGQVTQPVFGAIMAGSIIRGWFSDR
jgi:glycosyltransferase involved in cell wall biosynthesis